MSILDKAKNNTEKHENIEVAVKTQQKIQEAQVQKKNFNVMLDVELIKQLKQACLDKDVKMGKMVDKLIREGLKQL